MGGAALQGVVFLGHPFAVGTADRGGPDVPEIFGEDPDVFQASDYKRSERRVELQDSNDQKEDLRIPEQEEL